ncbi:hypothetical protein DFH09DRAFT_1321475 [Mycena vulgaris]|nr:hypothetical protein DFH09DRAFT_1321475 [Mycena vulgaris]
MFLDEPTSGLDAYNTVESLVSLVRDYTRTIIFKFISRAATSSTSSCSYPHGFNIVDFLGGRSSTDDSPTLEPFSPSEDITNPSHEERGLLRQPQAVPQR